MRRHEVYPRGRIVTRERKIEELNGVGAGSSN